MKRFYFCLMALLPLGGFCQTAQLNTYIDAIKLAELYRSAHASYRDDDSRLVTEFNNILGKYPGDFGTNPILKEDLRLYVLAGSAPGGSGRPGTITAVPYDPAGLRPKAAGSVNWQAAAINGLADFMAGRFRQEVLHYGLKNVFNRISREDREIFIALFPATFREVEKLKDASGYYSADLLFLRQIIQTDLDQLRDRLVDEMDVLFPKLKDHPQVKDFLLVGYHVYQDASHGRNLPEIIRSLAGRSFGTPEMEHAWRLNALMSYALRDTGTARLWVDPSRLAGALGKDNLVATYFFALLYQQLENDPVLRTNVLFKLDRETWYEKIRPMLACFNDFNEAHQFLQEKHYSLQAGEGAEFLRLVNRGIRRFMETPEVRAHVYEASDKARKALDLYVRISQPLLEKDYLRAIPVLINEMNEYLPGDAGKYRRSVYFVSQLASVKESREMEQLLQAYSLPIGGSSIKRSSRWNISLNGYVGATGGRETAFGSAGNQTKTNVGLSAPVGVALTGNRRFTVFASFIDLGSIVNVRLNNDTTAYSALKFGHFLAPGLGLFLNLPNSPVTLGAHYSYTPNLRNIVYEHEDAVIREANVSVSKLNFSLLVDIPFFTLFNKSR